MSIVVYEEDALDLCLPATITIPLQVKYVSGPVIEQPQAEVVEQVVDDTIIETPGC